MLKGHIEFFIEDKRNVGFISLSERNALDAVVLIVVAIDRIASGYGAKTIKIRRRCWICKCQIVAKAANGTIQIWLADSWLHQRLADEVLRGLGGLAHRAKNGQRKNNKQ